MTKKMYTKTTITEEPRLVISYDPNGESPREWSNLGYFITKDSNYRSPDSHQTLERILSDTGDEADSQKDHIRLLKKAIKEEMGEKVIAIYPITKYEHSGISYSLGSQAGFDYSRNGFYIITDRTQKELGTKTKDFEKVIEHELELYNQWCSGEIYQFTLYDETGEFIDSMSGFYKIEDIKEYLPEEWKKENLEDYLINE